MAVTFELSVSAKELVSYEKTKIRFILQAGRYEFCLWA